MSVLIETFGTERVGRDLIEALVSEHFDLRPAAFRGYLDLHRPIYSPTSGPWPAFALFALRRLCEAVGFLSTGVRCIDVRVAIKETSRVREVSSRRLSTFPAPPAVTEVVAPVAAPVVVAVPVAVVAPGPRAPVPLATAVTVVVAVGQSDARWCRDLRHRGGGGRCGRGRTARTEHEGAGQNGRYAERGEPASRSRGHTDLPHLLITQLT
ncbi:methionine adenosyltransferase domain-containing protein [Pseudonocardia sp. Cha107L01]|uniref:methionine adenosyltransferase domain-containing protein n=1 Tax=Pseudonocardia sp. Cha107L01 TaxID=3457576 RepID=UPI00403E460B